MHLAHTTLAAGVAFLLATPASALKNPDAVGACDPTTGGTNACGPNGSQHWLNNGLRAKGWDPPFLAWHNISRISIRQFYRAAGSPCEKFDSHFKIAAMKYQIDPAPLAFMAMQESGCDPNARAPTLGLMQCLPVYCQNGKSSCQFPIQDNVECAAYLWAVAMRHAKGNVVHALGLYNGWFTANDGSGLDGGRGMTEKYPCSEEGRTHRIPHNLNYLHEMLNGWFQGHDMNNKDQHLRGSYNCF
ncbi:glycoside hydrolase family 23 protein [Metarhizium album ARSEF 1941]|uniref:Glycoside hydrolase family 23 protein n=1 Tax=Metarhizium album (strain ARSEF 1941) TaxID=1081103 RepID=A0A0B2WWJ6_METAS|nr:glycoside hydrolase family 23 protein [Metarhizium album ARSEF 1941]KHO00592.1 glycoside hydrolase family 23 protein [Metarhizium album ARSEF 1941]